MGLGPALWLRCLFLWPVPEVLAPPLSPTLPSGFWGPPHPVSFTPAATVERILCQELREGVGKMDVPPQM